jgi:hypothetical protein
MIKSRIDQNSYSICEHHSSVFVDMMELICRVCTDSMTLRCEVHASLLPLMDTLL